MRAQQKSQRRGSSVRMGKPKSLKSTIKSLTLTLPPICMQTIPRTHSSRSLSPPPSRFFFSPYTTKSIMEERHPDVPLGSTHVVLSSDDPYSDFRTSMEEMVEALGVRSLDAFRELLSCYLKLNGRENHKVIMLAFLDLLLVGSLSDVSLESSSLGQSE